VDSIILRHLFRSKRTYPQKGKGREQGGSKQKAPENETSSAEALTMAVPARGLFFSPQVRPSCFPLLFTAAVALAAFFARIQTASATAIYGPFAAGTLVSPTSCVSSMGPQFQEWQNPANAQTDNALYSNTGWITTQIFAQDLRCTGYSSNFGTAIPQGAFVSDVRAVVDASTQPAKDKNRLRTVTLLGVSPGPASQTLNTLLDQSTTVATRYTVPSAGPADDWGGSAVGLTPAAANAPAFGLAVSISGAGNDNNGPGNAYLWWVGMTISYEIRATVDSLSPDCVLASALPATISVQGTGFVAITTVLCRFGATEVAGTLVSDTRIDCDAPGSLGTGFSTVEVSMDGGTQFSSNGVQLGVSGSTCPLAPVTTGATPAATTAASTTAPGTTGALPTTTAIATTTAPATTAPATTAPVTTASATTAPVTTASATTAPATTGPATTAPPGTTGLLSTPAGTTGLLSTPGTTGALTTTATSGTPPVTTGITTATSNAPSRTTEVTATTSESSAASDNSLVIVLVVVLVTCVCLCCLILLAVVVVRRRRKRESTSVSNSMPSVILDFTDTEESAESADDSFDLSSWAIPFDELSMNKELGRGNFGVVYRAKWRGSKCVVKQMLDDSDEARFEFLKEARHMQKLRPHPSVATLLGIVSEPDRPFCIVTELVPGGSLQTLLEGRVEPLSVGAVVGMAKNIASGMQHLHAENVLHCDLACRNYLVAGTQGEDGFQLKICDFGLSHTAKEDEYDASAKGTNFPVRWSPPEVLTSQKFSKASDVWSYAVSVWEMMEMGKRPFYELNSNVDVIQAVCKKRQVLDRPDPADFDCPSDLWELMLGCWSFKASERPQFADILEDLSGVEDLDSSSEDGSMLRSLHSVECAHTEFVWGHL
jgi:tRNA A-37 threonylcarbamoyl transferase component Bud32